MMMVLLWRCWHRRMDQEQQNRQEGRKREGQNRGTTTNNDVFVRHECQKLLLVSRFTLRAAFGDNVKEDCSHAGRISPKFIANFRQANNNYNDVDNDHTVTTTDEEEV